MKRFLAVLMSAMVMFSISACGTKKAEVTGDTVLIGGLAPLTGDVAVYGTTTTNGANLAFDEINAKGGILGGKKIEYRVMDEKGDSVEAINAFNKLVDENVVAILGDVTSKPSIAVAEASAEINMPLISATATHPAVTTYGENVFRVCFLDPFQGKTMAKFAADTLKAKKVAVMYNTSDDYSDGVATAFKSSAEELGLVVTAYEGYGASDIDFKTQLTNIAQTKPDAILFPDYYAKVALIITQAREVGLDCTLMGVDGWDGVAATVDAGNKDVLENTYFCNHYSIQDETENVQSFIKDYTAKYGEAPSAFAALGYDAAYVLANAIDKAGSTENDAIIAALKTTEHDGVTGKMTFDDERNPIKSVSIIKIVNGEYTFDSTVMPE